MLGRFMFIYLVWMGICLHDISFQGPLEGDELDDKAH